MRVSVLAKVEIYIDINMGPGEIALNLVISYIAGCIPTPHRGRMDIEEKLDKCFERALDKWNVAQCVKDVARNDKGRYMLGLKEIVTHQSKGRHPYECDLLRLWAAEIDGDETCSSFLSAHREDFIILEMQKSLMKADEVLDAVRLQKEDLKRLEEKLQQLLNRGVTVAPTYWDMWATGKDGLKLPLDIVLCGRQSVSDEVIKACRKPSYLCIESSSKNDAIAFVVASILKYSNEDASRALVVENAEAFKDLSRENTPLILITNVMENPNYAVTNGHTVIWCGTAADKIMFDGKLVLQVVDRDGFRDILLGCGMDNNKVDSLMKETKRESALLRRALGINQQKEEWMIADNSKYYIPAALLFSWDESRDGDKDLVAKMAGMDYAEFASGAHMLLECDESPLEKVGSVWTILSPKMLISRINNEISNEQIERFKECVDWALEDDDPDALAKKEADDLKFWNDKHLYSGHVRSGLLQSITILAVVKEERDESTRWIDDFIAEKLKAFNLERILSNNNNLRWVAECSPSSFVKFLEDARIDSSETLDKLFEVKHTKYGIVGTEIYYGDLLFCLEELAWDERFLARVTDLLLDFCNYPNDSNYANKPSNSLYDIYCLLYPQTLANFEKRLGVLQLLSKKHPKGVCDLCFRLLDGISQTVFSPTSHFRWRWADKIRTPKHLRQIPCEDVQALTKLLLELMTVDEDNVCRLIELATNDFMHCSQGQIVGKLNEWTDNYAGSEKVTDCLRKNINKQLRFRDAFWSMDIEDLKPYQELLPRIEPTDILIKNKHYFKDYLLREGEILDPDTDFRQKVKESRVFRKGILEQIIAEKGWDGVWKLAGCVNNTDGLVEAVIELTGDGMRKEVYAKYVRGELTAAVVSKYFRTLYYELGRDAYINYVEELKSISADHIAIVLYAPDVKPELIEVLDNMNGKIQTEYWENVRAGILDTSQIHYVIERLRNVGRYADILRFVYTDQLRDAVPMDLWLDILFEMFDKCLYKVLFQESSYVAEILKCVSVPSEPALKSKLMLLELIMFDHLRHHLKPAEFHLKRMVNTEPELMMELVQMAYRPDEGYEDVAALTEAEKEGRIVMARLSWDFFYHYHDVPGQRLDGSVDEVVLKNFITKLQECAKVCHREHVMPLVVGRILGNMPEGDNYPTDLMCELVVSLDSNDVDNEISCCLSNRRGMTSRSPFAGGNIERKHIETFKGYRDRAMTRSPRLVRVFENQIRSYEELAEREDLRGRLADLEY